MLRLLLVSLLCCCCSSGVRGRLLERRLGNGQAEKHIPHSLEEAAVMEGRASSVADFSAVTSLETFVGHTLQALRQDVGVLDGYMERESMLQFNDGSRSGLIQGQTAAADRRYHQQRLLSLKDTVHRFQNRGVASQFDAAPQRHQYSLLSVPGRNPALQHQENQQQLRSYTNQASLDSMMMAPPKASLDSMMAAAAPQQAQQRAVAPGGMQPAVNPGGFDD